jgi:hypothetical protein
LRLLFLLLLIIICAPTFHAQHHHDDELHFSHPLITESPSPDTKVRFDYFYRRFRTDRTSEHSPRIEFEYAFKPSFSVEVNLPYTVRRVEGAPAVSHADNMDVAVKLTNSAFKEHHVLLVYGVEFGLPTGSDTKEIGSSHLVEIAPYFGAGLMREKIELVGFATVSFATNKRIGDEEPALLGYQASLLFKPNPTIQPLIEIDGETVLNGFERGNTVVNLSPGIKFTPLHSEHWQLGAGIGFPITNRHEFSTQVVVSAFYHF